MKTSKKW